MMYSENRIIAPWTPEQIESMNAYQKETLKGAQYLCVYSTNHPALLATEIGWLCEECGYRAYWAYSVAMDWSWKERLFRPQVYNPYLGRRS